LEINGPPVSSTPNIYRTLTLSHASAAAASVCLLSPRPDGAPPAARCRPHPRPFLPLSRCGGTAGGLDGQIPTQPWVPAPQDRRSILSDSPSATASAHPGTPRRRPRTAEARSPSAGRLWRCSPAAARAPGHRLRQCEVSTPSSLSSGGARWWRTSAGARERRRRGAPTRVGSGDAASPWACARPPTRPDPGDGLSPFFLLPIYSLF
jgi:hypothetical protein